MKVVLAVALVKKNVVFVVNSLFSLLLLHLLPILLLLLGLPPSLPPSLSSVSTTMVQGKFALCRQIVTRFRNDFVRWFYDSKQQLERFDGPAFWGGEFYLATVIRDHSSQTETSIFYQEDDVTCITGPINGTMPDPDFSQFNYIGVSVVDYEKTYHFIANDPQRHVFAQIFSKVSDGDLFRVDFSSWRGNEKMYELLVINIF